MARLLSRGSAGADVSELQAALNFHIRKPAEPLDPDGKFGPLTEARVREFQQLAGIKVDGLVGRDTIKQLYRVATGTVEVTVVQKRKPAPPPPGRLNLKPIPRFGQVTPVIPDFVPPNKSAPQTRSAKPEGFDVESKVVFSPLDEEQKLKLTVATKIPWPVFLPKPLKLEIETSTSMDGQLTLDGKIKVPYTLIETERLELTPYFFLGAGVKKDGFSELNTGAAANLKLKLFELGRSGISVGVEADAGVKYLHDVPKAEGKFKGVLEGGLILERRF